MPVAEAGIKQCGRSGNIVQKHDHAELVLQLVDSLECCLRLRG